MSKIYVAGHQGLVGSSLLRALKKHGYTNLVVRTFNELDLRNQATLETFFAQERPEYVFLAAAKVGGILANSTYKAEFIYDNLMIAANVIHAAYKFGVKKLLNLGSSCIYPKNALQPLKEEYLLTGSLESTNEPYALAKIAAIKLCRYYNEQYHTNFISVMPTNLYGDGDNFNLETAHVLPALLRKFHLAKLLQEKRFDEIRSDVVTYKLGFGLDNNMAFDNEASVEDILAKLGISQNAVRLWGTGTPRREFLHVDDLAMAVLFLMEMYDAGAIEEIINIGCGIDITVDELAKMIKKIVGFNGDIIYDSSKPDGVSQKLLDISRLTNLGWQAKISLITGIHDSYLWYCKNINLKNKNGCFYECC